MQSASCLGAACLRRQVGPRSPTHVRTHKTRKITECPNVVHSCCHCQAVTMFRSSHQIPPLFYSTALLLYDNKHNAFHGNDSYGEGYGVVM